MTAREVLVDLTVTSFYHCIPRCVRPVVLCDYENAHRKQGIEERFSERAGIFAFDVCGFVILDNRLHLLLRLELTKAKSWTAEEVVKRWLQLWRTRDGYGKPVFVNAGWIAERAKLRTSVSSIIGSECHCLSHCTRSESGAFESNPHCLTAEYDGKAVAQNGWR